MSFKLLPHTPSLDGLLNLYSDLSSVFKLDIRSTENLPSIWQQPRASLLSMSQQLRVYTTSQKNASVFFTFFNIFLFLFLYNIFLMFSLLLPDSLYHISYYYRKNCSFTQYSLPAAGRSSDMISLQCSAILPGGAFYVTGTLQSNFLRHKKTCFFYII